MLESGGWYQPNKPRSVKLGKLEAVNCWFKDDWRRIAPKLRTSIGDSPVVNISSVRVPKNPYFACQTERSKITVIVDFHYPSEACDKCHNAFSLSMTTNLSESSFEPFLKAKADFLCVGKRLMATTPLIRPRN